MAVADEFRRASSGGSTDPRGLLGGAGGDDGERGQRSAKAPKRAPRIHGSADSDLEQDAWDELCGHWADVGDVPFHRAPHGEEVHVIRPGGHRGYLFLDTPLPPLERWVYRHYGLFWDLLYVGSTNHLWTRTTQHRARSEFWPYYHDSWLEAYPTAEEANAAELRAIHNEKPLFNGYGRSRGFYTERRNEFVKDPVNIEIKRRYFHTGRLDFTPLTERGAAKP